EFVYDPASGVGRLSASMASGVVRFVGGKISKTGEVQVKTPTATIGIRGGIALITVDASGATTGTLAFGKSLSITPLGGGAGVAITKPGFSSTVAANQAPTTPAPVTS